MAQDPFAQDAWTRARDRFIEDLSEEEKSIYHQGSLESIFYDASAAQKKHTAGSKSLNLKSKLEPLTSAIEQYGSALDVYANAYPLALSPLWGSLRLVLHLGREFDKYFERLIDMLASIGDVLPRFRQYEWMFANHERLVQKLSSVYVDILAFCSHVKTIFRRGQKAFVTNLKVFSKLIWKPFDRQFGEEIAKFRAHRDSIEKEAEVAHMIESAEHRALVVANQRQVVRQRRDQQRSDFLASLCPFEAESHYRYTLNERCEGTATWVLQDKVCQGWRRGVGPVKCLLHGIPGSGKSVLASSIVEKLRQDAKTTTYYRASQLDQRSLDARSLFGSLLQQLYMAEKVPEAILDDLIDQKAKIGFAANDVEILAALRSSLEAKRSDGAEAALYCIVDGIDEYNEAVQKEILRSLEELSQCSHGAFRLLLTYREEGPMWNQLKTWPALRVSESTNQDDIEAYVKMEVGARIDDGSLQVYDEATRLEIVQTLTEKSDGMFLWVHLQMIELCECVTPASFRETLRTLPRGLNQTYNKILDKIFRVPAQASLAQRVLQWLLVARRPMLMSEVQEAVAFDWTDKKWDPQKIPASERILRSCHGLVIMCGESFQSPRLAHTTIRQFLLVEQRISSLNSDLSVLEKAEKLAAEVCVAYLSFSDFERQVVQRPADVHLSPVGILGPGGPGTIPSHLGLGRPIFNVAYRLLGGTVKRPKLDIDFSKHLNLRPKEQPCNLGQKYSFLGYAREQWTWHTKWLLGNPETKASDDFGVYELDERYLWHHFGVKEGKEKSLWHQFALLISGATLASAFRPWGVNRHWGPYGCSSCPLEETGRPESKDLIMASAIHYSIISGHFTMLLILTAGIVAPNFSGSDLIAHLKHEEYSEQSLRLACEYGNSNIVTFLVHCGAQVKDWNKLLVVASRAGNESVVPLILSKQNGSDLTSSLQLAIFAAIECEEVTSVAAMTALLTARGGVMLSVSQSPTIRSSFETSYGKTLVDKLFDMLEKAPDTVINLLYLLEIFDVTSTYNMTALMWATTQNKHSLVFELLQKGADVEKGAPLEFPRGDFGSILAEQGPKRFYTPLFAGIRSRATEAVRLLLHDGADFNQKIEIGQPKALLPSWRLYPLLPAFSEMIDWVERQSSIEQANALAYSVLGRTVMITDYMLELIKTSDVATFQADYLTAACWAILKGQDIVALRLAEKHLPLVVRQNFPFSPLECAVLVGNHRLLASLNPWEWNAIRDKQSQNPCRLSVFHLAVMSTTKHLVSLLLQALLALDFELHSIDVTGLTAYEYARDNGFNASTDPLRLVELHYSRTPKLWNMQHDVLLGKSFDPVKYPGNTTVARCDIHYFHSLTRNFKVNFEKEPGQPTRVDEFLDTPSRLYEALLTRELPTLLDEDREPRGRASPELLFI